MKLPAKVGIEQIKLFMLGIVGFASIILIYSVYWKVMLLSYYHF